MFMITVFGSVQRFLELKAGPTIEHAYYVVTRSRDYPRAMIGSIVWQPLYAEILRGSFVSVLVWHDVPSRRCRVTCCPEETLPSLLDAQGSHQQSNETLDANQIIASQIPHELFQF